MHDFQVTNHGSIVSIRPLTDQATDWLDRNVEAEGWQWLGGGLCIEPRMAGPIIEGIESDGFEVSYA